MQPFRFLHVRDCQGTLWAFYRRYEGQALASFEGDLESLGLEALPGSSLQETAVLRRQTLEPQLDFVVVPLTPENIASLKERLSKPGVLGRHGAIVHTQMEAAGEAVLIACESPRNSRRLIGVSQAIMADSAS